MYFKINNLSFKNEIDEYYLELENHFVNPILKEYLEFVESIIDEYPRAMAIKYILARGSNIKMYSRLPYYSLNEHEHDDLVSHQEYSELPVYHELHPIRWYQFQWTHHILPFV